MDDIRVVIKVALESVPYHRSRLFKYLLKNGGSLTADAVQRFLNCSRPVALKEIRTLSLLNVVDESYEQDTFKRQTIHITTMKLKPEFGWLLNAGERWVELL